MRSRSSFSKCTATVQQLLRLQITILLIIIIAVIMKPCSAVFHEVIEYPETFNGTSFDAPVPPAIAVVVAPFHLPITHNYSATNIGNNGSGTVLKRVIPSTKRSQLPLHAVLHIGPHKTASTHIQNTLFHNRMALSHRSNLCFDGRSPKQLVYAVTAWIQYVERTGGMVPAPSPSTGTGKKRSKGNKGKAIKPKNSTKGEHHNKAKESTSSLKLRRRVLKTEGTTPITSTSSTQTTTTTTTDSVASSAREGGKESGHSVRKTTSKTTGKKTSKLTATGLNITSTMVHSGDGNRSSTPTASLDLMSLEDLRKVGEQFTKSLTRCIHRKQHLILSSEEFSLFTPSQISILYQTMSHYFPTVHVLLTYREFFSRIYSLYTESYKKTSAILTFAEYYNRHETSFKTQPRYNLGLVVDRYQYYFNLSNILILDYDGIMHQRKDIAYVFSCVVLDALCPEMVLLNRRAKRENKSPVMYYRHLFRLLRQYAVQQGYDLCHVIQNQYHRSSEVESINITNIIVSSYEQQRLRPPLLTTTLEAARPYAIQQDVDFRQKYGHRMIYNDPNLTQQVMKEFKAEMINEVEFSRDKKWITWLQRELKKQVQAKRFCSLNSDSKSNSTSVFTK